VRKIISDRGFAWNDTPDLLAGKTLGETFLTPTRIYVKPVLAARQAGLEIHGMAHITGGGLPENLPRCLGQGQAIKIDPSSWSIPPVFQWLAEAGSVSPQAMYHTFNMGIGFVLLVPPQQIQQAITHFESQNVAVHIIGEVITGSGELVGLPE
jgi:phosphoribosylformylglycinamidine cyclo-ligase